MALQMSPRTCLISALKTASFPDTSSQAVLKKSLVNDELMSRLLDRRWSLSSPDAKIHQIVLSNQRGNRSNGDVSFQNITQPCLGEEAMFAEHKPYPSFYVVRDDLLHPLVNGNKARKLDALLPLLQDYAVTDVLCLVRRGIKPHLLLRGEEPETLTGYNLVSKLYGNVVYVPRSIYAKREEMLAKHAELVAGTDGSVVWLNGIMEASSKNLESMQENSLQVDPVTFSEKSKKVVIINEGAGDAVALLGVMRLITYLSQNHLFGRKQALKIVVDAGTGTTAVGLALGVLSSGLPWEVTAVMLADTIDSYKRKEQNLISEFLGSYTSAAGEEPYEGNTGIVQWVERRIPRKFGKILEGEVQQCQNIARQTGVLVDPIYTLAAWDLATLLSQNGKKIRTW